MEFIGGNRSKCDHNFESGMSDSFCVCIDRLNKLFRRDCYAKFQAVHQDISDSVDVSTRFSDSTVINQNVFFPNTEYKITLLGVV